MSENPQWHRYLHFWRRRAERDVDTELAFHVEARVADLIALGMSPEAARAQALHELGDVKEVRAGLTAINRRMMRNRARAMWWENASQDVRYALRGLRRSPGFAVTIILTLALGIGAAGSMYGVMWRLLRQPPPHVVEPERVVRLYQSFQRPGAPANNVNSWPWLFHDVVRAARTLSTVGAYATIDLSFGSGTAARPARAVVASGDYWRVLAVRPRVGRFFDEADAHPATGIRVVVISHALWLEYFAGQDAIGRAVRIRGNTYEVIGVAPRGFRGVDAEQIDIWLPLVALTDPAARTPWYSSPIGQDLDFIARLAPGTSAAQAAAELTTLMRPFFAEMNRRFFGGRSFFRESTPGVVASLTSDLGRGVADKPESRVVGWLVGVGIVLLAVACSNVGGLLLLRAMRRRREIAVRVALGMSRRRLAMLVLTEALVLAVAGGVAALALLAVGGAWAEKFVFPHLAWERPGTIEPAVLGLVAAGVMAAFLLSGFVSLRHAGRDVGAALRDGAQHGSTRRSATQRVILVAQAALSVVLLVGAALFVRSLRNLLAEDLGVDPRHVYSVTVDFSGTGRSRADMTSFFERARQRVALIRGIERTSLALDAPLLRSARAGGSIRLPGHDTLITMPGKASPLVNYVTEDFFATTGMRVLRGRAFAESERDDAPVVIVNETMASLYWPGRSGVGECVFVLRQTTCTTVVGVVGNQHLFAIREAEERLFYYRPLPRRDPEIGTLLLRSTLPPAATAIAVRRALQELEPGLPYVDVSELFTGLEDDLRPWRLGVTIFTAFGTLAVILAAIGLSSAIAYAVTQRSREIGVRMAVGAGRRDVMLLVLGDGLRIGLAGVGTGTALAMIASPWLGDLLHEVSPRDATILAGVAAAVLAIALAATFVPARRAAGIDPMRVLSAE